MSQNQYQITEQQYLRRWIIKPNGPAIK